MKNLEKTLDFNGVELHAVNHAGGWWIAMKYACGELGIDYQNQFKRKDREHFLKGKCELVKITASDNKKREMVCMKEMDFYQWVLNARSSSEKLRKVQLKIYDILYQEFKGSFTGFSPLSTN